MVVIRSIAVILCFLLPAAARATTYQYTGSQYAVYGNGATPEDFGDHMTATVTTIGDTTDASGKYDLFGGIDDIQITSGPLTLTTANIQFGSFVTLDHGSVSGWFIVNINGLLCGSGGAGFVKPCELLTGFNDAPSIGGEHILQICQLCGPTSEKGNNQFVAPGAFGTWAVVSPVPAPVLGSGIGGLALLISFFVSRSAKLSHRTRRERRSIRRRSALIPTTKS